MMNHKLRLDPRTLPRERMLARLGERRPKISIISLFENLISMETVATPDLTVQHISKGARESEEALEQYVNRVARLGTGSFLVILREQCSGSELVSYLEWFLSEPWLGVVTFGMQFQSLMVRECLWSALDGLELGFFSWNWSIHDFCQRAQAIGYSTRTQSQAPLLCNSDPSPASQAVSFPRVRFTVYTSITQSYDTLKPQPRHAVEGCEQIAFLDPETTRSLQGQSRGWSIVTTPPLTGEPHRDSRFPKINAHLVLPKSDYSLWIDASIGIVCPFPLERLAKLFLKDCDICVFRHYMRQSIYEEADACIAYGRDQPDTINAQIRRYRAEGLPTTSGLIEAPILLRRHTSSIQSLNTAWWEQIIQGSRRDQLSFNYVTWKLGLRYGTFPLTLALKNGLFVKFIR